MHDIYNHEVTNKNNSSVIKALHAQKFQAVIRLRALESENHYLRLCNKVLESRVHAVDHQLSELRSDYCLSIAQREALVEAAKRDHQKIRTLVSDVDNAQNFITAMMDINLPESFLLNAAKSTINKRAQAASSKGSAWSKVVPGRVCMDTAVDLTLKDDSSFRVQDSENPSENPNEVEVYIPSRSDDRCCNGVLEKAYTHIPSGVAERPSVNLPEVRRLFPDSSNVARPSAVKDGITEHIENALQAVSLNSVSQSFVRAILPEAGTNSETSSGTFKKDHNAGDSNALRFSNISHEPMTSKSNDTHVVSTGAVALRKVALKADVESMYVALPSARNSILCLTALESLERLCAMLSNSDLGSLEITTDDDQSQYETDIGHSSETESDTRTSTLPTSNKTQRESFVNAMSSVFESDLIPRSVTPRSTVLTPLETGTKLSDTDGILTETSHPPEVKGTAQRLDQELNIPSQVSSRASLDLSNLPILSGIAIRRTVYTPLPSLKFVGKKSNWRKVSASSARHVVSVGRSPEWAPPVLTTSDSRRTVKTCVSDPPKRHFRDSSSKNSVKSATRGSTDEKPRVPKGYTTPPSNRANTSLGVSKQLHNPASVSQSSAFTLGNSGSTRRGLLQRLTNIPQSVTRSRKSMVSQESNKFSTAKSLQAAPRPISKSQTPSSKVAVTSKTSNPTKLNFSRHVNAKAKSNAINIHLPVKRSPLSQNMIVVSSDLESEDQFSSGKPVSPITPRNTYGSRVTGGLPNKGITPSKPAQIKAKSVSKTQTKKNANDSASSDGISSQPTAAFMKPADRRSKITKRMTNSIKPLIPTWTSGMSSPAQCQQMFGNGLSMVVR